MNFDLDENQTLFQATVERFGASADVPARHRARALPNGFNRDRWKEMAELGLIGIAAAESDGGLGGSLLDCAVVAQALGKAQSVEPWLECGFLPARLLSGTPHVGDVIAGKRLAAFAFAEPGWRYAMDAQAVRAKPSSQGHSLSGEKHFVLSGASADTYIVTAQNGDATDLFAVHREMKGVDVKPYPVVDGSIAVVLTLTMSKRGKHCLERLNAWIRPSRRRAQWPRRRCAASPSGCSMIRLPMSKHASNLASRLAGSK